MQKNEEFGFPVYYSGNLEDLKTKVLKYLCDYKSRLCGSHLKFIRESMGLCVSKYAQTYHVSPSTIRRWEKKTGAIAMTWAIEKFVRLDLALFCKATEQQFVDLYDLLVKPFPIKQERILIDG